MSNQLEPGPMSFVSEEFFRLRPDPPEFAARERSEGQELDTLAGSVDRGWAEASQVIAFDLAGPLRAGSNDIAIAISTELNERLGASLEDAFLALPEIERAISDALAALPEEAWRPIPGTFSEPPEAVGFTEGPLETLI